jgi:hypothetical protein
MVRTARSERSLLRLGQLAIKELGQALGLASATVTLVEAPSNPDNSLITPHPRGFMHDPAHVRENHASHNIEHEETH